MGGLGFSMKWNMGWMNDTLDYFSKDPLYRPFHHNQLTFSQMYAYSENFILPFSHDEVVHMKGSLAGKMPGDDWQKMANLRLLLSYQWLHPGKKLLFMGCDFGQWTEWNASASLPWHLCDHANHRGIMELVRQLNRLYCSESALHERDFEHQGFSWIDCHDYSQSVISFARYSADDALVCVFNFTPVPRYHYRLGLPGEGEYQEIFNSDSVWYGGSNLGNSGALTVERQSWQNQPVSACLTLPPLGCVVFKRKQNKAQASTPLTES
jgi:1,4-alpha-glucan branching enzyme